MGNWDRSTPWRQGAILPADAITVLDLAPEPERASTVAVVVSHDCDLAQPPEAEPAVEIIVGRLVDGAGAGNFMHCKNVRRLHVHYIRNGAPCVVELEPLRRIARPKCNDKGPSVSDFVPAPEFVLEPPGLRTLRRWLAARYDRSAFPDEFDRRLDKETDVADRLARAFKTSGKYIPAVYFDLDEGAEVARTGPNDTYALGIVILYQPEGENGEAEKAVDETKARVLQIFSERCVERVDGVDRWKWIELQYVQTVSAETFTYAQMQQLKRWNADHVSLRPERPQATEAG